MCSANGASGKSIENGEKRVMEYRRLEDEEYLRRLKVVITGSEGLSETVENIGDGKATIGYGYTFNRSDNAAIWREAGITLNEQDHRLLATVDAAADGDKTRLALGFSKSMSAAEGDDLFRATVRRYNGPADSLDMPNSDERIALVSLAYNRGVGNVSNHPVMEAIRDGDRAEAWFQIRYNCWGSDSLDHEYPDRLSNEGGLRKRRFAEAEVFSLYDNPASVSADEAKSVYRMFQLHRGEIDRVESSFGVTVDGQAATRNRIAEANRDYHGLVDTYGRVQVISDALAPARDALLQDLRRENPDIADRLTAQQFNAGRIFLDPGRALRDPVEVEREHPQHTRTQAALRREQGNTTIEPVAPDHAATLDSRRMTRGVNAREVDSNDLLIGEGGDDTLRAHRGDDILIGGAGRDRMEGGVGQDTHVIGSGDTIRDSDGHGELRWNHAALTGGSRSESDPANTYRSADGQYTYTVNGSTLDIANRQGETTRVEDYARGDLGLRLQEPANAATASPPAQEGNAQAIERLGPQDRAVYDRMLAAVHARPGQFSQEQQENIAAAGLAEYRRRDGLVQQPQDIGVYGDRLFVAYFPHGPDREPNFHANVRMDEAARTPAQDSVQQVDALARERAMAPPQQQLDQPAQQQGGPTIGARGL